MKYLYAYRNIAIPANVVTVLLCIEIWRNDSLTVVSILAWTKVFTTLLLTTYIYLFRSDIVFFFMNLGISRRAFYASLFLIDMVSFVVIVTVIHIIK